MAVAGISWMEAVFVARKVHMALLAIPGRGLSVSRYFIALSPIGVAALPSPSILAAMFIAMVPSAG